jgi:hypothetical protein
VDAGIPQAETRGTDACARVAAIDTFWRACTRAFAHRPADNREIGSATHASEHRVRAEVCTQQLQNCAGTGAAFSHRDARLSSMPVLLQQRIQFARHTVQLLSKWREMRAGGHCGVLEVFSNSNLPPNPFVSLTCTVVPHTMASRHDRPDHFPLPRRRETGRRRDGRRLQS